MKKIFLAVITFLLPFLVGCFYLDGFNLKSSSESYINSFLEISKQELLFKILLNNLKVILINIIGCLSFGIITFLNTAYNGLMIGLFTKFILQKTNLAFVFLSILPHSIELIGIILSCYIGHSLAFKLKEYIFEGNSLYNINDFKKIIICFLITILSAFLEVFITIN